MRKYLSYILISGILFFIGLSSGTISNLYGQNSNIVIVYQGVKNDITIRNSHLAYSWHIQNIIRTDTLGPRLFSGETAECNLTDEQMEEINKWFENFHGSKIKGPESLGDLNNPDFAYRYNLYISGHNKQYNFKWTRASTWGEEGSKGAIFGHINQLKSLCEKFIEENKK